MISTHRSQPDSLARLITKPPPSPPLPSSSSYALHLAHLIFSPSSLTAPASVLFADCTRHIPLVAAADYRPRSGYRLIAFPLYFTTVFSVSSLHITSSAGSELIRSPGSRLFQRYHPRSVSSKEASTPWTSEATTAVADLGKALHSGCKWASEKARGQVCLGEPHF